MLGRRAVMTEDEEIKAIRHAIKLLSDRIFELTMNKIGRKWRKGK